MYQRSCCVWSTSSAHVFVCSPCLLTSGNRDSTKESLTENEEIWVPCGQSCLLTSSCGGTLQLPNAFFPFSSPLWSFYLHSRVKRYCLKLTNPTFVSIIWRIERTEEVFHPELTVDIYQNLLTDFKLKLAGVLDRRMNERMLPAAMQPFM